MSITPQDLQKLLDEREASRASRKRAWENLQEIRWVLKDIVGIELPPPARKTIDLEGRLVKDGVQHSSQGPPGCSERVNRGYTGNFRRKHL